MVNASPHLRSQIHASVLSLINAAAFEAGWGGVAAGVRGSCGGPALTALPRGGAVSVAPPAASPPPPPRSPAPPARTLGLVRPSLPVSCQPGRDIPAGDLGDYVPPEKRAVDHANCFGIPIKLRFLPVQGTGREGEKEKRKAVIVPD